MTEIRLLPWPLQAIRKALGMHACLPSMVVACCFPFVPRILGLTLDGRTTQERSLSRSLARLSNFDEYERLPLETITEKEREKRGPDIID